MGKLVKSAHVALVALLVAYCGLEVAAFALRLLSPGAESVRFWKPGPEVGVIAVALVALLGIFACSTGVLKPRGWRILAIVHGTWLVCLTWFGWFSIDAPFRLRELVSVDLDDPRAVRGAEMLHAVQATAVYLVIVVLTSLPLLILLIRRRSGDGRQGQAV